jgi:hypothetical protein
MTSGVLFGYSGGGGLDESRVSMKRAKLTGASRDVEGSGANGTVSEAETVAA